MASSVQNEIEQLTKSGKRSDKLIATFKEGYIDNWYMAVKDTFRAQLDIKFTSRVDTNSITTEKTEVKLWTQGPRIGFDKGHILFNTQYGYQAWGEAIKFINLACVVKSGKPNDVKKIKSPNGKKTINKLIDGFVKVN